MTKKYLASKVYIPSVALVFLMLFMPIRAQNDTSLDDSTKIRIGAIFRAYFLNDQRLQWSGMEATFGVESVVNGEIQKKLGWGEVKVFSQFFVNQPFDRNQLADESRRKYLANFTRETLEIKQLYIQVVTGKFIVGLGKHASIFGNTLIMPLFNSFWDYPFIRNEAVLNYETGIFCRYTPGIFTIDVAIVNGSENLDTNSMKCGMLRLGLTGKKKNWSIGASIKVHDGIGSEWQKQYKNHAGIDFMMKTGRFRFSSEFIYDQYGFHRAFAQDDIFWGRSYYYRDILFKVKTPITGIGGYFDFQYEDPRHRWFLELNYGEYYPKKIGHPYHDDPIKRTIVKIKIQLAPGLYAYSVGLIENDRAKEPLFSGASPYAYGLGLQYCLQ